MATRRDLYEDAVRKLSRFVPAATKEDFVTLVLAGGSLEASANTTQTAAQLLAEKPELQQIKDSISPVIDLINGGKHTWEILESLGENLSSAGSSAGIVKQFLRFTLPEILIGNVNQQLIDEGIVSGVKSFTAGGDSGSIAKKTPKQVFTLEVKPTSETETIKINSSTVPDRSNSPHVTAIELLNPRIGTAVRDIAGLSIFCSMVPTHIMSRAVPYVSVKVYTPDMVGTNVAGQSITKSMNMLRYLKGERVYTPGNPIDAIIGFTGVPTSTVEPKPGGMELFTSPQTMVTDQDDYIGEAFKYSRPVDRFRPLMTLNDLSFEVVSAGAGMMSYKQASMNLTLHDRGRLSEISSFVKPGAHSKTEVEIEYGWSVDPSSSKAAGSVGSLSGFATADDAFSQFIDSLRVKEKYSVVNSTFNFDDAGQVNISLTLSMKGASDIRSFEISEDVAKTLKKNLIDAIEDIQRLISKSGEKAESLFGETLMSAVSSPESALSLSAEDLSKVQAAINQVKASAERKGSDFKAIRENLSKVFNGNGSSTKSYADQAAADIKKQLDDLVAREEIFPSSEIAYTKGYTNKSQNVSELIRPSGAYKTGSVSLGKVLIEFVGKPLAKSGKYDEIQFIFNKLNERAGFVRNLSMAAFPLDVDKLQASIKDLYSKNVSVSLSKFTGVIAEQHVDNVAYPAYGFSSAYDSKNEYKKTKINNKTAIDYVDSQLAAAGILDCTFQQPKLSVVPEAVPSVSDPKKTILRIHVTDASCTPYQSYSDALTAGRSDSAFLVDMASLESDQKLFKSIYWADLDKSFMGKIRQAEMQKMQSAGVLKPVGSKPAPEQTQVWKLDLSQLFTTGDPKVVKRFFSESLPVIRYGSSGGLVKSISVSSIADPQMATINILKQDESSSESEAASRDKGLPLMVAPTEVSVELLGCPIINFGQAVYIDFGTNTTIDNIYVCTNLSHKIAPGDFSTSAKFTLNVGAYGIYNSTKRSVDITSKMLEQINQETIRQTLQETANASVIRIAWGTDIMQGITYEQIQKARGKTSTKIRAWNSASISSYFKGGKLSTSVEIVNGKSMDAVSIISEQYSSIAGISCYEFPFPPTGIIQGTPPEIKGVRYSHYDRESGTPVIIDMTEFNKIASEYLTSKKRTRPK